MVQMTGGYNMRYNTSTNNYFLPTDEMSRSSGQNEQRMVLNFANAGNNCSIFPETGLLDCGSTIGRDIKTCQQTFGKKILLSIGGATYLEGGFVSDDAAIAAAEIIWQTFGPTDNDSEASNVDSSSLSTTSTILTASNSLPSNTNTMSILQQPADSGVTFAIKTSASEDYSGSGLRSTTATSSLDVGASTLPTMDLFRLQATAVMTPESNATGLTANTTMSGNGTFQAYSWPVSNATLLRASNTTNNDRIVVPTSIITRRSVASILRPFGDAVIDGFDFDLETSNQNFVPFARRLRQLMDIETAKTYYLTAAPQCPFPDGAVSQLLESDVRLDAVFVQFYNNYCGLQSFTANTATQVTFNFNIWDAWAKRASARWAANTTVTKRQTRSMANVKVYLGIPAALSAASSGYASIEQLKPIVDYSRQFESFGGVMMWDASQAKANEGFLSGVKRLLTTDQQATTSLLTTSATATQTSTATNQSVTSAIEAITSSTSMAISSLSTDTTTSTSSGVVTSIKPMLTSSELWSTPESSTTTIAETSSADPTGSTMDVSGPTTSLVPSTLQETPCITTISTITVTFWSTTSTENSFSTTFRTFVSATPRIIGVANPPLLGDALRPTPIVR